MKIKIGAFLSRWLTNKYVWVGVVLVLLLALYSFNPVNYVLMPKCAFKLATGYSCPGCGFLRATHAALHGHWVEAWAYNRMLIYSIPYALCLMVGQFVLRGEWQRKWRNVFESRTACLIYIGVFCIWWIVRNVMGI